MDPFAQENAAEFGARIEAARSELSTDEVRKGGHVTLAMHRMKLSNIAAIEAAGQVVDHKRHLVKSKASLECLHFGYTCSCGHQPIMSKSPTVAAAAWAAHVDAPLNTSRECYDTAVALLEREAVDA